MDVETITFMDEKLAKCKENCVLADKELRINVGDKLERATFFWVMGVASSIVAAILGSFYGRIGNLEQANTKVYFDLSNRLTAIETNTANTSKQVEQLQKFFANYNIK